ncbi:hypothetical protein WH50_06025 [Pokkaliibacter plantistimulans]|uniref:Chemotaxis protein n=1 Tax=Pokkaliibacter plantistimulans TaxID=1635171 RepID=A0ABX5LZU9_9GAMM|nr:methyl-accepting chemotaxis protein [Pokkaliibacter plantistimulans]PXF32154.1 hypothetical protein WH50_06025 [Pokkaliibacter plantistimulans]
MAQQKSLSIVARIWSLFGLFALCLLTCILVVLHYSSMQLRQSAQDSARQMVEAAEGVISDYRQRALDGKLSTAAAQAEAIAIIETMRFDQGNYVFIHSDKGVSISNVANKSLQGKDIDSLQDPNGVYIVREIRRAAMSGGGFASYQWHSPKDDNLLIDKVTYSAYIKDWGWVVACGVNMGKLDADLAAAKLRYLLVSLLALLVMAIIATLLIRSIIRPLSLSVSAMQNLASGEGDLTRQLATHGPRELAEQAHHFNSFNEVIRQLVSRMAHAGHSLNQAAHTLAGVTQTTEQALHGQLSGTEQLAEAMERMVRTVHSVATLAEQADEASTQASEETASSRAVVNQAMQAIGSLSVTLSEASQAITRLEQQSGNIDQVLSVIRSIAEQTNLLALNAAIEAARAGEAGRGFAVVADEVRTLAQRTQESTSEIQGIIGSLKEETRNAVSTMQEGVSKAQSSASLSSSVEGSLNTIVNNIQSIHEMNTRIADTAEEQVRTADEINYMVRHIRDQSGAVAGEAAKTSDAARDVSSIAGDLSSVIARFTF